MKFKVTPENHGVLVAAKASVDTSDHSQATASIDPADGTGMTVIVSPASGVGRLTHLQVTWKYTEPEPRGVVHTVSGTLNGAGLSGVTGGTIAAL